MKSTKKRKSVTTTRDPYSGWIIIRYRRKVVGYFNAAYRDIIKKMLRNRVVSQKQSKAVLETLKKIS